MKKAGEAQIPQDVEHGLISDPGRGQVPSKVPTHNDPGKVAWGKTMDPEKKPLDHCDEVIPRVGPLQFSPEGEVGGRGRKTKILFPKPEGGSWEPVSERRREPLVTPDFKAILINRSHQSTIQERHQSRILIDPCFPGHVEHAPKSSLPVFNPMSLHSH